MEILLVLIGLYVLYRVLKFIQKVLQNLQHPSFDSEAYHRAQVDVVEQYSDDEEPSRVEQLKEAYAELKTKEETRQAIENELGIKM